MVAHIDDVSVGAVVVMRDPHAGACSHDRLQGRDDSTGGNLDFNRFILPIVNVGLPVRDDQHFVAGQMVVEKGLEGRRLP